VQGILQPGGSALGPDVTRTGLRGLILSIWAAWPQIWPEWASEALFSASGRPGPRYD